MLAAQLAGIPLGVLVFTPLTELLSMLTSADMTA